MRLTKVYNRPNTFELALTGREHSKLLRQINPDPWQQRRTLDQLEPRVRLEHVAAFAHRSRSTIVRELAQDLFSACRLVATRQRPASSLPRLRVTITYGMDIPFICRSRTETTEFASR